MGNVLAATMGAIGLLAFIVWKMPNRNSRKTYYVNAILSAEGSPDIYATPTQPTEMSYIVTCRPSELAPKLNSFINLEHQSLLVRHVQVL